MATRPDDRLPRDSLKRCPTFCGRRAGGGGPRTAGHLGDGHRGGGARLSSFNTPGPVPRAPQTQGPGARRAERHGGRRAHHGTVRGTPSPHEGRGPGQTRHLGRHAIWADAPSGQTYELPHGGRKPCSRPHEGPEAAAPRARLEVRAENTAGANVSFIKRAPSPAGIPASPWSHHPKGRDSHRNGHPSSVIFCCGCCSAAQSCPTLCDPMDCSTAGLPDHHQLPESTQTHVH